MSDNAKRKPIKAPVNRFKQQPRQKQNAFTGKANPGSGKRAFNNKAYKQ